MECKQCKTSWDKEQNRDLKLCPLCFLPLEEEGKEPFEIAWARMIQDQMKGKYQKPLYDQITDYYVQGVLSDPASCLEFSQFLEKYPEGSPNFSKLNIESTDHPALELLRYGASREDPRSFYELFKRGDQEYLKTVNPHNPLLKSLRFLAAGKREAAFDAFHEAVKGSVHVEDPKLLALFFDMDDNVSERLEKLDKAAKEGSMFDVLHYLYNKVFQGENPYGHLEALPQSVIDFLKNHPDEWEQQTKKLIDLDIDLHGIQLAANTLQSMDEGLKDSAAKILDENYKKAYLRPFEEVEATSLNW